MIKKDFNSGWAFTKNGKTQMVTLPHDAMLTENRKNNNPSGNGCCFFEGGFYTYQKNFVAPIEWSNQCVYLEIEGCYRNAKVYLNDMLICEHKYGYTGFTVDLSDYLSFGSPNHITITADNLDVPNSRWYSGAGLYRKVFLWIGEREHFDIDSIMLDTLSINPITLGYRVSHTAMETSNRVLVEVLDKGNVIGNSIGTNGIIEIPSAIPWDLDNPKLYDIKFTLFRNDEVVDTYMMPYGFRTIEFKKSGFYLNGRKTIMKGCCLHHDNGILGAISIKEAEYRKLLCLKNGGFNAIRSSHNPCSKDFLAACDELGILIMDEYSDMWYYHKNPYDYATDFDKCWRDDITYMVKKDYNHPSVVLYSLGNELGEPSEGKGLEYLTEMVSMIHHVDRTRKTTMGINFTNLLRPELDEHKRKARMFEFYSNAESLCPDFNKVANAIGDAMADIACAEDSERCSKEAFKILDIAGYNYAYKRYALDNEIHPERIMVGTETMCHDVYKNYQLMQKYPQVIGDFMWTGYDYIGEIGIGGYADSYPYFAKPYPWILANGGAYDLLGNPTGEAFLANITYGSSKLEIATHIPMENEAQSAWRWTFTHATNTYRGQEGKYMLIQVFSSYPEVEVIQNGHSLGKKKVVGGYVDYDAVYDGGYLSAIAYFDGVPVEEKILMTCEKSHLTAALEPKPFETDIQYIRVSMKDSSGTLDFSNKDLCEARVVGAELLGFGSANPISPDSFLTGKYHLYHGEALLCVRKTMPKSQAIFSVGEELVALDF